MKDISLIFLIAISPFCTFAKPQGELVTGENFKHIVNVLKKDSIQPSEILVYYKLDSIEYIFVCDHSNPSCLIIEHQSQHVIYLKDNLLGNYIQKNLFSKNALHRENKRFCKKYRAWHFWLNPLDFNPREILVFYENGEAYEIRGHEWSNYEVRQNEIFLKSLVKLYLESFRI